MKLSKRYAALLRDVKHGNLSTAGWRDYVPLSNKRLVTVGSDVNIFGMRRIELTTDGAAWLRENPAADGSGKTSGGGK